MQRLKDTIWKLTFVLCISIGLYALVFLFTDLIPSGIKAKIATNSISFHMHLIGGAIALMIAPFSMNESFRNKHLKLHKYLGRVYVPAAIIAAVSGIDLAINSEGGFNTHLGFALLGFYWLISTTLGFYNAFKTRIQSHQRWMIRSFAAALAGVTLRLELPFLIDYFGEFLPAYEIVAWLCWLPNILIAEYYIARICYQKIA